MIFTLPLDLIHMYLQSLSFDLINKDFAESIQLMIFLLLVNSLSNYSKDSYLRIEDQLPCLRYETLASFITLRESFSKFKGFTTVMIH